MKKQTHTKNIKIGDIDERYKLVTDSQDIAGICHDCGVNPESFGCLFVEVHDAEYGEIWGCYSNVPRLHYELERIR